MLKLLARIWFFDKFKLRIIIKNRTTYSKKYRLNFWYKYTTKPIWILFQHGEPLLLEQLLNKTVILYTQCAVKLRFYLVVPYVTVQYFSPTYRKLFANILHQHTFKFLSSPTYRKFFTNILFFTNMFHQHHYSQEKCLLMVFNDDYFWTK